MKRLAIMTFLLVESAATVLWWGMLAVAPWTRPYFFPHGWSTSAMWSFGASDLPLIVIAGLAAALGIFRRRPWAPLALCLHIGGVLYGTLYTDATYLLTRQAALGAILMSLDTVTLAGLTALYLRETSRP